MNVFTLLFAMMIGMPAQAAMNTAMNRSMNAAMNAMSNAATSPELEGIWIGVGQLDEARRSRAVDAKMKVGIFRKKDKLNISECWDTGEEGPGATGCILSHYDVDENSAIFFKGRKVGDIYPGKILVYIGNGQVSEQLQLDLHGPEDLVYQYNYSNFDGDSAHRKSVLKRMP